ncbi:unnamed protein product [Rodentolepis nana]|uniref:Uncharacterized protein n=1 Tax=Rodentolepis nana TaxID=102285 RepID=A0A0R3TBZ1_RODNA|nr:unnamed protein product [Rodentolepis nana]
MWQVGQPPLLSLCKLLLQGPRYKGEMIKVRDMDRENYEFMMRLLNTPEFANSVVREELMTANAMRVLWVCHGHFVRNDGGEEEIKPERNEEKMDLDPSLPHEGVSTEVAVDPVLLIPESLLQW